MTEFAPAGDAWLRPSGTSSIYEPGVWRTHDHLIAIARAEAAEAKLAAIRELCDADDFDIETARIRAILNGEQ